MFSDVVPEELVSVLDERVGEVLAQAGIIRPPVNALQVAAAVGMVVALDERQAGRARRVRSARHVVDLDPLGAAAGTPAVVRGP